MSDSTGPSLDLAAIENVDLGNTEAQLFYTAQNVPAIVSAVRTFSGKHPNGNPDPSTIKMMVEFETEAPITANNGTEMPPGLRFPLFLYVAGPDATKRAKDLETLNRLLLDVAGLSFGAPRNSESIRKIFRKPAKIDLKTTVSKETTYQNVYLARK